MIYQLQKIEKYLCFLYKFITIDRYRHEYWVKFSFNFWFFAPLYAPLRATSKINIFQEQHCLIKMYGFISNWACNFLLWFPFLLWLKSVNKKLVPPLIFRKCELFESFWQQFIVAICIIIVTINSLCAKQNSTSFISMSLFFISD